MLNKENLKIETKKNVDKIFAKIDEYAAKKNQVKAELRPAYEESLAKLESKKADLKARYQELVNAGEDKMQEAKEAISSATDSINEGFTKIQNYFNEN